MKKTIFIDLDGVLNKYDGNFDENFIPPIQDAAKKFLEQISQSYLIKLFTTRNTLLASKWVIENGLDEIISDVTNQKGLGFVYIDDRCINFSGNYEKLIEDINNFKPWFKK